MDRTERFYRIQQLLRQSRVVPVRTFLGDLEISLATFKRRLVRAEQRFLAVARTRPELETWLEKGTRWSLGNQG